MTALFQKTDSLTKNEPLEILIALDQLSSEIKKELFPDYEDFLSTNPVELLPLLKRGISRAGIDKKESYAGVNFISLKHNKLWNDIGNTYAYFKKYDKAIKIFKELYANKGSDSSTITNYAAALLNKMIEKHKIESSDEDDFELSKRLLFNAFIFDSKSKPKKNLSEACILPAYKNLILVRNIESEHHYNKKSYFLSFTLGWISIEMSLNRIWCQIMSNNKTEKEIKEELASYDIQKIMDLLLMLKVIPKKLYSEIKGIKDERNKLIHGTALNPTKGMTQKTIELGRKLIPILNP